MFDTLEAVREDVFERLTRAGRDRKSPMHTPVVGTADADLRVMVLREFDSGRSRLRFHTDARAPKCARIGDGAPLGVLFYDPPGKVQIRAHGEGRILTEGLAVDAAWQAASEYARRCYLAVDAPGAEAAGPTSGLPPEVEGIRPDHETLLPARENFALLMVELSSLDWLYLAHDGHRRARFRRDGSEWRGGFAIP